MTVDEGNKITKQSLRPHRALKEFKAEIADSYLKLLPEIREHCFLAKVFQEIFRKQACRPAIYAKQIGRNYNMEQQTSG